MPGAAGSAEHIAITSIEHSISMGAGFREAMHALIVNRVGTCTQYLFLLASRVGWKHFRKCRCVAVVAAFLRLLLTFKPCAVPE